MPIKTSKIGENKGNNAVKRINDIKKNSFEDKIFQENTSYSVEAEDNITRKEEQRQHGNYKKSLVSYRSSYELEERFPAQPRPESITRNSKYQTSQLQNKELSEMKKSSTNKVLEFLENRTMFSQEFKNTQNTKDDNESGVTYDGNKDICSNETMESREENCETLRDASCSVLSDSVANETDDEKDVVKHKCSNGFIDFSTCNIVKSGREMFLEQCSVPCTAIYVDENKERENSNDDVCRTKNDILKDKARENDTLVTEQTESTNMKDVVLTPEKNKYENNFSDIHVLVSGVQDLIDELLQTPMEKKIKRFDPLIIEQMSSNINEKNEKEILSFSKQDEELCTTQTNGDTKKNNIDKSPKDGKGRKSPVEVSGVLNEEFESSDGNVAETVESSSCNESSITTKSNRSVIRSVSMFISKKKQSRNKKTAKTSKNSSGSSQQRSSSNSNGQSKKTSTKSQQRSSSS